MSARCEQQRIKPVTLMFGEQIGDERGFFIERFKESVWRAAGVGFTVKQVNHSRSAGGVLRGLHYQLEPRQQGKIVSVLAGEIFDVAVDVRQGSPWFGQWVGARLSEQNKAALYVPAGFAHGFCVLSDAADVLYYCDAEYAPAYERGIFWQDPAIGIDWPLVQPRLSAKDSAAPLLSAAEYNFTYGKE